MRYARRINLNGMLRGGLGGHALEQDFGVIAMVRLIVGTLLVGGHRLRHVRFLQDDPVFGRFAGLSRLPDERTLSRWLKRFGAAAVGALARVNGQLVGDVLTRLRLRTLTIDVDGTVLSTGLQVERAFRGFNPHHRKVPSYYPITAVVGESGHVLRVKNRSGDVHDGKASPGFFRDIFSQLDETLAPGIRSRFRMDAAFFRQDVIRLLEARGAEYTIKAPFWPWLGFKNLVGERRRWRRVSTDVDGFHCRYHIEPWNLGVRVFFFRKRVSHFTKKNFQLDLFDPDDGHYEYSAVVTNLPWDERALWRFMCGRGQHEKIIGELKNGFGFDSIPTNEYGANSAWQQLSALAYNLLTSFQLDVVATPKPLSQKRTARFVLKSVRTLRFELINRAGQVLRPRGRARLRLAPNVQAARDFRRAADQLARAA